MNERQIELYNLLKTGTHSRQAITVILDHYYGRVEEIEKGTKDENSAAFRLLRKDIVTINKSNSQHKVVSVLHKGRLVGYKLGESSSELLDRADRYHAEAMRMLEIEKALRTAVKNDGQMRIASGDKVKEIKAYGRTQNVR